jgi:hypothetical protein
MATAEVAKELEVSENSFHHKGSQDVGMRAEHVKRLSDFQGENAWPMHVAIMSW